MKRLMLSFFVSVAIVGCGGGGGGSDAPSTGSGGGALPGDGGQTDAGPGDVYQVRNWSEGFQLSNPNREASNPVVDVLPDGSVVAAWVEAATASEPASVFASVMRADLSSTERQRDNLAVAKLNTGADTVLSNTRWNFTINEVERFKPSPQLAVSEDRVAHVAWLQRDGATTKVHVSDYAPQGSGWSAAISFGSDDETSSGVRLVSLPGGDAFLVWKQSDAGSLDLKGAPYYGNTGVWGSAFEIAADVKASADVSVWSNGAGVSIGYLSALDLDNDRLSVAKVDLDTLAVSKGSVDSDGLKGSVVGVDFKGEDLVAWAELDEYGYYSVMGAANKQGTWQQVPEIEGLPYDAGHIDLAVIGDGVHIVWRQTDGTGSYLRHDLNTAIYKSTGITDFQTLTDIGAANPVLINGEDGKAYLQWFMGHTTYSEYVAGEGWKPLGRPFCMQNRIIDDSCFNSGTEQTIDVAGDYGIASWLESVDGIKSVVVSLSDN